MQQRNDAYAQSLAALLRVETISSAEDTDLSKFRAFHALLEQTFPAIFAAVEREEFDGSLLLRWRGADSAKQPVLLMSHHDVVEATGTWTHGPFSGDIAGGKVWGRGALDTKGSLWAMLQAADELAAEGFVPGCDVYFSTACNEECSGAGASAISQTLHARGVRFSMTLDEGGMITQSPIDGANGTFAMVGVGEKGYADLKFIARSAGGHASTPDSNTPLVRLGRFMAALDRSKCFDLAISPTVAEMLRRIAPSMRFPLSFICAHADTFRPLLLRKLPRLSPAAGAMVKTTLAFTMAQGSQGHNVLPQEAWVIGNMRFSPHQGQKSSIDAVRALAEKFDVETEVMEYGIDSPVASFEAAPFRLVEEAVSAVFPGIPTVPYVMNGATDSRYYARYCENCLRFSPLVVTRAQFESIHAIDENVDVAALAPAVDFYKYILRRV